MTPVRVAVQIGAGPVRVAVEEEGSSPPLVVELPAPRGPADLPALVAGVVGPVPIPTVLVHPAGWGGRQVAAWGWEASVPAPVAAAAGSRQLVVDVGARGSEVALVDRGRVLAQRRCEVGGGSLDAVVARLIGVDPVRARRVREALSLLPVVAGIDAEQLRVAVTPLLDEVVAMVRDVRAAAGPVPVLLIGGVARCPLLAELLDEAGVEDVVVADRPEAAAVRGALALAVGGPAVPLAPAGPVPLLPPPPSRAGRPVRGVLGVVAAAGTAVALFVVGTLLTPSPSTAVAASVPAGVLVQYGYRFDMPVGWEHSGGLPERRRSLITPSSAPEGSDLIAVERTPLGYDSGAEPQRAATELRATFDAAVAAGDPLSDYGTARVGSRPVTTYRQRDAGGGDTGGGDTGGDVVVEWFVVLDGDAQLSVGCRHTPAGEAAVRAACEEVVGSVGRV